MRTRVDLRLLQELREFELRFCCEDCCYFQPEAAGCALGYPNHEHRRGVPAQQEFLVFCKEFELGA